MNRIYIIALLAVMGISLEKAIAKPPQPSAASATNKPVQMTDVPSSMAFELRNNLVVLDTTIGGRRQRAVLDSGSGALIVDQEFARRSGLTEGKVLGNAAGAGNQAQSLRPVVVPKLSVGPLRFMNLGGYSMDLGELARGVGFPIALVVGAPAFKHGVVAVDYARQRVTFGPSGSAPACASPIPLTIVNDVPVVEVKLRPTPGSDAIPLKLVVDLGTMRNAVMLGGPFVRSDVGKALILSGVPRQVGHGTGGKVQGAIARVAELGLGAFRTPDLEVALTSGVAAFEAGFADGSLGVPFWQGGVITFDYPAKTLCIEK